MGLSVSKKELDKVYKRVSYAEARRRFAKLVKANPDIKFEEIWNSHPITVNFSLVADKFFPSNSKSEFIKFRPTTFEILGSCVYDPDGPTLPDAMSYLQSLRPLRNSLIYILGNRLAVEKTINVFGFTLEMDPSSIRAKMVVPPNLLMGLDKRQYDALFNRPQLESSAIVSTASSSDPQSTVKFVVEPDMKIENI